MKKFPIKYTFFVAFLGLYTRFFFTNDLLTILFALVSTGAFFWMEWQEKFAIKLTELDQLSVLKNDIIELKAAVGLRNTRRF
jgi:hypothetical protein